jgi:transcriptional regulator with XRE-family HTH domain
MIDLAQLRKIELTELSERVGEKLRQARERAGLNQPTLGARLGVTKATVSHWEAGRHSISIEDLIRVSRILDVPLSDLLPEDVATRLDKARFDPRLADIVERWSQLSDVMKDGLAMMVRDRTQPSSE